MKFKKILIVCLTVAMLATMMCTSVFASNGNYGHYISPGDYVLADTIVFGYGSFSFDFNFTAYVSGYHNFESMRVDNLIIYFFDGNVNNNYGVSYSNGAWNNDLSRYITVLDGFYIYDANVYQWWQSNVTRIDPGYDSNLFDGILSAFTFVGSWLSGATTNLTTMFYANESLTFLGTLAVAALAFAVSFLIIGLIQRFLKFRG